MYMCVFIVYSFITFATKYYFRALVELFTKGWKIHILGFGGHTVFAITTALLL